MTRSRLSPNRAYKKKLGCMTPSCFGFIVQQFMPKHKQALY